MSRDWLVVPKTVGALVLLQSALPVNLAITGVVALRSALSRDEPQVAERPRTVMISGGKMTKALQLARSFHDAGHRVVLVETAKYRLTGHRFSNAVDAFHTVPRPQDPGYAQALLDVIEREHVDVYVPVCSPVASWYDALAKPLLTPYCDVVHCDPDDLASLDDKFEFATSAASLGLPVPDTHRITDAAEVAAFDFAHGESPYVLKSIPYDPVNRLDLTLLPRESAARTAEFARSKPISERTPWILQSFVRGQEYCTHGTARNGELQVYACCESSASQLNYEMIDKPAIETWVRTFVAERKLTGQVSFDFIETPAGELRAIECNPRTHSAITMFYNHPGVANAYLDDDVATITPLPSSRPTYWLYNEVWHLLRGRRGLRETARTVLSGKDAIFDWSDPLPFLMVHHVHIPSLMLQNLFQRKDWVKVDFNIGKLVEVGGD